MGKKKFVGLISSLALCCALSMGVVVANAATPVNTENVTDKTVALSDLQKQEFIDGASFVNNYNHLKYTNQGNLNGYIKNGNDTKLVNSTPGMGSPEGLIKGTSGWMYYYDDNPCVDNINIHLNFENVMTITGFELKDAGVANQNLDYDGKGCWYEVYTSDTGETGSWTQAIERTETKKTFGYGHNFFNKPVSAKYFRIKTDTNNTLGFSLYFIPTDENSITAMETETNHLIACAEAVKGESVNNVSKSDIAKAKGMLKKADGLNGSEKAQQLFNTAGYIKGSVLKEVTQKVRTLTTEARDLLDKAVVGDDIFQYSKARYDEFKSHVENGERTSAANIARTGDIDTETDYFTIENRIFAKDFKNAKITSDELVKSKYAQDVYLENLVDGADGRTQINGASCKTENEHWIQFDYGKEFTFTGVSIKAWLNSKATYPVDWLGFWYESGTEWINAFGGNENVNVTKEITNRDFPNPVKASKFRIKLLDDNPVPTTNTIDEIDFIRASSVSDYSVTLGEDLSLNYFATVATGTPTMRFTSMGKSVVVDGEKVSETTNKYKFTYTGITPDKIGDKVVGQLLVDGKEVEAPYSASVKDYCKAQLANPNTDEKTKNLLNDLLVYGGAAQNYTGYKTYNLVNDGITGSAFTNVDKTDIAGSKSTNSNVKFTKAGLILSNKIYVYFDFVADDISKVTVKINDKAVNVIDNGNGSYRVITQGLKATELNKTFTAKLFVNNAEVQNMTYSAKSYVYYAQGLTGQDTLANLVKAMYNYGLSANAYVGM